MPRLAALCTPLLALLAAPAALAHVTAGAQAHGHASDVAGLLAVVALAGAAAWLGRHGR